jgi:hypothetical protein
MMQMGVELSQSCGAGDFIVVELKGRISEKFMVCCVVPGGELHDADRPGMSWFGRVEVGDAVLRVRKLEPVLLGGTVFEARGDEEIAVFAEDVRMKLRMGSGGGCDLEPAPVPEGRATRASPRYPKYTLVSSAHASILQLISPVDGGAADKDDPHRLSGFKVTDEETGAQYLVEGFKEFKMVKGKQVRSFTVRILETGAIDIEEWLEGYLLEKLPEVHDAAAMG